jgi:hypothetical protein
LYCVWDWHIFMYLLIEVGLTPIIQPRHSRSRN